MNKALSCQYEHVEHDRITALDVVSQLWGLQFCQWGAHTVKCKLEWWQTITWRIETVMHQYTAIYPWKSHNFTQQRKIWKKCDLRYGASVRLTRWRLIFSVAFNEQVREVSHTRTCSVLWVVWYLRLCLVNQLYFKILGLAYETSSILNRQRLKRIRGLHITQHTWQNLPTASTPHCTRIPLTLNSA